MGETVEEVEAYLDRCRATIEKKRLRVSLSKTEYLVPSYQQGVMQLEGEPLPWVNNFKYHGTVIYGIGWCGNDVDVRITAGDHDRCIYQELFVKIMYM